MSGPPNQDFPPQDPQPWVPPQQPHQGPPHPPQPFVPQQGWNGPPPPFPPQPGFAPPGFPPPLPPRKSYAGLIIGLVAFGVLAAIVLVGVAIVLQPSSNPDGSGGSAGGSGEGQSGAAALPTTRQPDGSVAVAKAGVSSPVLDIYEDFQCPVCKSFESTSGATLSDLAAQGKVKLVYRPFRLFDQEPLRSNSARAANAAACAPAGNWVALHRLLFQSQPPEGSAGFSTSDLVSLGQQAGISDSTFSTCVGGGMKSSEVEQSTKSALAAGVQGTPTLRLDGTDLSTDTVFNPESLRSAILAKQGGAGGGSSGI